MPLNIHLIDDSSIVKQTLNHFLYHYHPHIESFNSKNIEEEYSNTTTADLILVDLNQINLSVCSSIKEKGIPIVLIYNNKKQLNHELVKEIKYEAFLRKPIIYNDLIEVVSTLVPKVKEISVSSFLNYSPPLEKEKAEKPNAPTSFQPIPIDLDELPKQQLVDQDSIKKIDQTTTEFRILTQKLKSQGALEKNKEANPLQELTPPTYDTSKEKIEEMIEHLIDKKFKTAKQKQEEKKIEYLKLIKSKLEKESEKLIENTIKTIASKQIPIMMEKIVHSEMKKIHKPKIES